MIQDKETWKEPLAYLSLLMELTLSPGLYFLVSIFVTAKGLYVAEGTGKAPTILYFLWSALLGALLIGGQIYILSKMTSRKFSLSEYLIARATLARAIPAIGFIFYLSLLIAGVGDNIFGFPVLIMTFLLEVGICMYVNSRAKAMINRNLTLKK